MKSFRKYFASNKFTFHSVPQVFPSFKLTKVKTPWINHSARSKKLISENKIQKFCINRKSEKSIKQGEREIVFSRYSLLAHFLFISRLMHNLALLSLESTLFKVIFYVLLADTNFLFLSALSPLAFRVLKECVIYISYTG